MLATLVDDPAKLVRADGAMGKKTLIRGIFATNAAATCSTNSICLIKIKEWTEHKDEFVKRAGFVLNGVYCSFMIRHLRMPFLEISFH